jgi:hypothetical protein
MIIFSAYSGLGHENVASYLNNFKRRIKSRKYWHRAKIRPKII